MKKEVSMSKNAEIDKSRLEKGLYWQRAWKLVEGCTKVSPGCDNCWSEAETVMRHSHPNEKIHSRAHAVLFESASDSKGAEKYFAGNVLCREDNLDLPLRVKKPTVWAIWNDLWHDNVPTDFIIDAYQVMERAKSLGHIFLVLTKRAERMGGFLSEVDEKVPGHIWHGVTAENQDQADTRIPHLLNVPGKRFLSIEPMLGPVDLSRVVSSDELTGCADDNPFSLGLIHAVLLGGESGKDARPMHPEWVRLVRDQCEAAGVPFFFKQWGEWTEMDDCAGLDAPNRETYKLPDGILMWRVGKKKAGRTLDGRLHNELPWR